MYFGDGASTFYPLVGLDVLAHEVSHGYTEQNSNLEYAYQPGGINEAFSDMAGEAAEFFFNGENDFLVGDKIYKAQGEGLRDMEDTTLNSTSTASANDYYASLTVPHSPDIYNRPSSLLTTTPSRETKTQFLAS